MNIFDALPKDLKKHTFKFIPFKKALHAELKDSHDLYVLDAYPYLYCDVCNEYRDCNKNWCIMNGMLYSGKLSVSICSLECFDKFRSIETVNEMRVGCLPDYEISQILQRFHFPRQHFLENSNKFWPNH